MTRKKLAQKNKKLRICIGETAENELDSLQVSKKSPSRLPFFIPLIFTLSFLVVDTTPAWAQDIRQQLRQEARLSRLLELEYSLAQEPKLYLVFRLTEKRVEFRLRGSLLKILPVQEILVLGRLPQTYTLLTLRIKETTRPPQRIKVNPLEMESTTSTLTQGSNITVPSFSSPQYNEPDMLELKDMPSRYNLVFDEGLTFMVRPAEIPVEEKGFQGRMTRWGVWWSDAIARVKHRLGREQVPQLRLTLPDEACRSIFWSFSENARALFIP